MTAASPSTWLPVFLSISSYMVPLNIITRLAMAVAWRDWPLISCCQESGHWHLVARNLAFWWSFQLFLVSYYCLVGVLPRKLIIGHLRVVTRDQAFSWSCPLFICATTTYRRVFASIFLLAHSDEFGCFSLEFEKVLSRTLYAKYISTYVLLRCVFKNGWERFPRTL